MKGLSISLVLCSLLSGRAALAACTQDKCLRAVIGTPSSPRDGKADCESYLALTVTAETSTFTDVVVVTTEGPATATEVDVVTEVETVTAATETVVNEQTVTVPETITVVDTVTATQTVQPAVLSARETLHPEPSMPEYASAACLSFDRYQSACARASVFPTTVTLPGPSTTITVTETVAIGDVATESTTVIISSSVTDTTLVTNVVTVTTPDATVSLTTTETATVTAVPANPEIVANGGFETGTLAGWTVAEGTSVTVIMPGKDSQYLLRFGDLHDNEVHTVSTTMSGVPETTYSCSLDWSWKYFRALSPYPGVIQPAFTLVSVNGTPLRSLWIQSSSQASTWNTITFNFVSKGNDVLQFQAKSPQTGAEGDNWFYLDNVSCQPVSGPLPPQ